jgi:hypothetical protein
MQGELANKAAYYRCAVRTMAPGAAALASHPPRVNLREGLGPGVRHEPGERAPYVTARPVWMVRLVETCLSAEWLAAMAVGWILDPVVWLGDLPPPIWLMSATVFAGARHPKSFIALDKNAGTS